MQDNKTNQPKKNALPFQVCLYVSFVVSIFAIIYFLDYPKKLPLSNTFKSISLFVFS